MKLIIIAAMTSDRVIGKDGKLPWHMPEDLRFFKRATLGHALIMGRKTFESMGRALPRRRNVIVTRQLCYPEAIRAGHRPTPSDDPALNVLFEPSDEDARRVPDQTCIDVVHSLNAALELCRRRNEAIAFVIGGGEIFNEALPIVDEMYITFIEGHYPGDTYFPQWHPEDWKEAGAADPEFTAARRFVRA